MGFESILDLKTPVKGVTRPAFFQDLNVDQIIERVTGKDRKTAELYEYFPLDEECEIYRHRIYNDIRDCGICEELQRFVTDYNEFRDIENKKKVTTKQIQKPVWHFCGMEIYTRNILRLKEVLEKAGVNSDGFKMLLRYLEEYTGKAAFMDMAEKSARLKKGLESLEVIASYVDGRIIVSVDEQAEEDPEGSPSGTDIKKKALGSDKKDGTDVNEDEEEYEEEYEEFLKSFKDINAREFVNPFASTDELTSFEQEIMKIVAKRNPEIFKEAAKLYDQTEEYEDEVLGRLADELKFYLSFYDFESRMKKEGFCFTSPGLSEKEGLRAEGLYDLALACVNLEKGRPTVSNDFSYDENELFFVLTGPNQGGKTTFARSLGQLVFFSKLGFDVAAVNANVPYFPDILTHFSVEESVETGRGKLMEELVRLSPMMKKSSEKSFVIINELFTTAANYDAIIMGQNVLKHFLDADCHGIYVTHLKELCDIDERITGLSAQLDENGIQNFKIRKQSVDYEGCAKNQVEKYGLSYEKLKERLKLR